LCQSDLIHEKETWQHLTKLLSERGKAQTRPGRAWTAAVTRLLHEDGTALQEAGIQFQRLLWDEKTINGKRRRFIYYLFPNLKQKAADAAAAAGKEAAADVEKEKEAAAVAVAVVAAVVAAAFARVVAAKKEKEAVEEGKEAVGEEEKEAVEEEKEAVEEGKEAAAEEAVEEEAVEEGKLKLLITSSPALSVTSWYTAGEGTPDEFDCILFTPDELRTPDELYSLRAWLTSPTHSPTPAFVTNFPNYVCKRVQLGSWNC